MKELKMLPVSKIYPHPDNPRKDLGDLTELTESIKQSGILQNLTVVPKGDNYTVIIGHRRLAASKAAGLTEVPCAVIDMSDEDQLATMLIENMQRSDLTVLEEAEGFQMMLDLGKSYNDLSSMTGFSETKIRQRVKLTKLDKKAAQKAIDKGATLYELAELDKVTDENTRAELLKDAGTANFNNALKSALKRQEVDRKIEAARNMLIMNGAARADKNEWNTQGIVIHVGNEVIPVNMVKRLCAYSSDFDINIEKEKEYYYIDNAGELLIYTKKTQADIDAEDAKKAASDLEKNALERRREALIDITERHQQLRIDFIKGFDAFKEKQDEVFEFVSKAIIRRITRNDYSYSIGGQQRTERLAEWLGVGMAKGSPELNYHDMLDLYMHEGMRTMFLIAAFAYECDNRRYWTEGYSPTKNKRDLIHMSSPSLDEEYTMLSYLGYKISTEEREMKTGEHELFEEDEE